MLDRLRVHRTTLFRLREFLEWLEEQGVTVEWQPGQKPEDMLLRFLDIDPDQLEDERRALLEEAQEAADDDE